METVVADMLTARSLPAVRSQFCEVASLAGETNEMPSHIYGRRPRSIEVEDIPATKPGGGRRKGEKRLKAYLAKRSHRSKPPPVSRQTGGCAQR